MSRRAGARRGQSLTQYVSDNSKRHADKILLPTGAHRFPILPTISTSLWVKVQKFDLMRLLLSTSTGSKFVQRQWLDDLDYFHEADTEGKVYIDVIKEFCEAGNRMHVARSTLEAIIMPTDMMIKVLRHRFIGSEPTFEDTQAAIEKEAVAFECLFNKTDTFKIDYPQYTADDVLDLMEWFHHIKPLGIKSGDQVFLCTCCDAYQKYCCVESTALSLLYNLELETFRVCSRSRSGRRLSLPTHSIPSASKRKEEKANAKAEPKWKPHMPVFAS